MPVRTTTAMGVTTDVVYDAWGRRTVESAPYLVGQQRHDTTTQYDLLGRVKRIDRPDGSWVEYGYTSGPTGLFVTLTESVRYDYLPPHITHQIWAASGSPDQARLVGVQDPGTLWTSYAYTDWGGLSAVCGPGEATYEPCVPDRTRRAWEYNDQHLAGVETHPESGRVAYTYYPDGLLESRTDASGVITYQYDGNHRLTGVQTPGRPNTGFEYDHWDNRTVANNGYALNTYTYTGGQQLSAQAVTLPSLPGNPTFTTLYTEYDERDNLRELHYPSGQVVRYDYDADSRMTRLYHPGTNANYAQVGEYEPTGAVHTMTLGNGIVETIEYDDRSRPEDISNTALTLQLHYTYDDVGNVRTLTDSRPGYNQAFNYDALDRLTSATGVYGTQTFTYDPLGNRCGVGSVCSYNPATQRLDSLVAGGATTIYNYDLSGSLQQQTGARAATYTYTPHRMMETATTAGTTASYTYDSDGLRVKKSDPTTTHAYVHGLGSQLLVEYVMQDVTPVWDVAYLYLGSRLVGAMRPSSTPAMTIAKESPGNGAMGLPSAVTLEWSSTLPTPSYAVCWDTLNNDTCDTSWVTVGAATTKALTSLATGTYYWQVKDTTTGTLANGGMWWHFTVGTVTSAVSKLSPPNGPVGLGRTVTLQWGSTYSTPNYWLCLDTSNNNTCNYFWWPHGATATHTYAGLASGTYYWQVKGDGGGGAIEADGGTWWAFTVAPPPYAVTVVPWGSTQTWLRWADEAEDQTDFHVERSANGGPWTQILEWNTYQYLDPNPPCGPVEYRVRAHWHGLSLYSAYSPIVSIRACAPVAPSGLAVREWWGATRLDWVDQSWDESDFHVERQVDWGEWEEITLLAAGTQNYVDSAQVCGLVAYRVRAHRHDSQQYSPFSNVASRTKSCGDTSAGLMATDGGNGMTSTRGKGEVSWWTWRGLLYWMMLGGLLLLAWRHRAQAARTQRHRRVMRPATHLAHVGLLMLGALLLPASTLAQSGQVVEYYHLDALGSVRAVSNEQGQVVSRHDFLPFGEEWTPATPQRENKLFTGHERDPESGLDYFGARYYDNRVGRFTTIDPIYTWKENLTDPERWNRYAYARNNPLKYVDPDGRDVWLYTERISTQNAGWIGAILGVRHSVLRVQIDKAVDMTIELTASPDGLVVKPVNDILDVFRGRAAVEAAWVQRPDGVPIGDWKFEEAILAAAAVLGKNLPQYDYANANCNAFARFLVEIAGGKVKYLPDAAGFSNRMEAFRRAYEEQLEKEQQEKEKRAKEEREKQHD